MRYFEPVLDIPATGDLSGERLGGLPFGLPAALWPKCRDCGGSQTLLAQFAHHPERLDLGREGRSLYVFECDHDPGVCETWEAFEGANACVVLEPEASTGVPTVLPADQPTVSTFAAIVGWSAADMALSAQDIAAFDADDTFFALPSETLEQVTGDTRLGGVPCWLQSPSDRPPGWRFIGQMAELLRFRGKPSREAPWLKEGGDPARGWTHYGVGPNFGGGIAFLFLRETSAAPEIALLWQQ